MQFILGSLSHLSQTGIGTCPQRKDLLCTKVLLNLWGRMSQKGFLSLIHTAVTWAGHSPLENNVGLWYVWWGKFHPGKKFPVFFPLHTDSALMIPFKCIRFFIIYQTRRPVRPQVSYPHGYQAHGPKLTKSARWSFLLFQDGISSACSFPPSFPTLLMLPTSSVSITHQDELHFRFPAIYLGK